MMNLTIFEVVGGKRKDLLLLLILLKHDHILAVISVVGNVKD